MNRAVAGIVAAALAVGVASALAVRSCGSAAREPDPVATPATGPAPPAARPRAERPVAPALEVADHAPDPAPPAPAELPEEFRRPPPAIVVVTCDGRAVPGCAFAVERPSGAPRAVASLSAAEDGTYRLDVDEDVAFPATVLVRAAGWEEVRVDVPARESPVQVRLSAGGSVAGVVRFSDGRPVARARVVLAGRIATSDGDGRFSLGDVAVGRHERAVVVTADFSRTIPCDAEVRAAGASCKVELTVPESDALRVRVVRESDGAPVAGVSVEANGAWYAASDRAVTRTDESGLAALTGLADGRYRIAVFGDEIEAVPDVLAEAPREEPLEIRTRPYVVRRCSGRVVDPAGKGVAGLELSLYPAHVADAHRATTAKDGSFAFTGVRAFLWRGTDRMTAPPLDLLHVTLRAKAVGDFVALMLRPVEDQTVVWAPSSLLTLTVVEPTGAPLPDVHLQYDAACGVVLSTDRRSDGRGSALAILWRARFVAPGTLRVRLGDGRSAVVDVPAVTGDRTALGTLRVEPSGRVRLHVDPPVAAAEVSVADDDGVRGCGFATAASGWLSSAVPAGRRRVLVTADGRLGVETEETDVPANGVADVSATLPSPSELTVFVSRAGRPLTDARVLLEPAPPPAGRSWIRGPVRGDDGDASLALDAATDAAGRATFRLLPPGPTTVRARSPDGAERTVEIGLPEGRRESVDVVLE